MNAFFSFSKEWKQKFKPFTPRLPYKYGLIKTHKPVNPVRPIISSIGSCSYELSKWLAQQLLIPYIGTISNSHIINNLDLVSKLSSLNVNYNYKLVSFDVESLFTNVPVYSLLHFMKDEFSDEFSFCFSNQFR